jgi:hypothetical protein
MAMALDHGDHIGPEYAPDDVFRERWIRVTDHDVALAQARREGIQEAISILKKMISDMRPEARVNYPKAVALSDAIDAIRLLAEE